MNLRVHPLHDIVDKNCSFGINRLPLQFCFFVRKEAWLREDQCSIDVSWSLKGSKVRCRLANFLLEFLSWATKSLYQTIVVGRTSNDVIDGPDERAYQLHYFNYWLRGRWIWEIREIVIQLLEKPVELTLQLWKPAKQLESTPNVQCIEAYRLETKSDRTLPRRRVSLSVPKRRS